MDRHSACSRIGQPRCAVSRGYCSLLQFIQLQSAAVYLARIVLTVAASQPPCNVSKALSTFQQSTTELPPLTIYYSRFLGVWRANPAFGWAGLMPGVVLNGGTGGGGRHHDRDGTFRVSAAVFVRPPPSLTWCLCVVLLGVVPQTSCPAAAFAAYIYIYIYIYSR